MKATSRILRKHACLAVGALSLLLASAQAATYPLVVTNAVLGPNPVTFTLTEVDAFSSSGTASNTVSIADPGAFFCETGWPTTYWQWRDFSDLNLSGGSNPGGLDLLEGDSGRSSAPDLRTTIAGLAAGTYEVYLVQIGSPNLTAGLRADLETAGVTAPTTFRTRDASSIYSGRSVGSGYWVVDLDPLGQVTGTSFSVLVGVPGPGVNRGDYIGLAYRLASNVSIGTPPSAQTVYAGTNATFSVSALGAPPLRYQWLKNGATIPDATNATLNFANPQAADAALYSVVVSNNSSRAISAPAPLNVFTPQAATQNTLQPWIATISLGTNNASYTYIPADGFNDGGTPGNTVRADGSGTFFSELDWVNGGTWMWRDFAGLDMFGVGDPAGLDLLEGHDPDAPDLLTTITNLPSDLYLVYLVYQTRNDGGENPGLRADIQAGGGTTATTVRQAADAATLRTGMKNQGIFEVVIAPLGQVSGTGFNVLVGSINGVRGDYLGLAYRKAPLSGPQIVSQPAALQVAFAGSNVTFSAAATGNPVPTYQWRKNGVDVPGATSGSYTNASPLAVDAGNYTLVASNSAGFAQSQVSVLNVFAPLPGNKMDIALSTNGIFRYIPADGFNEGGTAGNTVRADGSGTFFSELDWVNTGTWNWRDFGGLDMFGVGNPGGLDLLENHDPGAPDLLTTISGLTPGQVYDVFLVYQIGLGCSIKADIKAGGATTATTVRAQDAATLRTGKVSPGAPMFEVSLQPLGQVSLGSFGVLVGSTGSSARSDYVGLAYKLAAQSGASIIGQPTSQTVFATSNATFSVTAAGNPLPTCQWRKNGVNIPGATTQVLSLTSVQATDAGVYSVVVSNGLGSATSQNATLSVFAGQGTPGAGGTVQINLGAGVPFTYVPADAFVFGGTIGNTVQTPNPSVDFAVIEASVPGYWNYRDWSNLNLFAGANDPAAPDLLEANAASFPNPMLRTTVPNLSAGAYEVCLVQLDDVSQQSHPKLLADIETGSVTTATTVRSANVAPVRTAMTANNYEVVMHPLGQATGSGFSVLVAQYAIDPSQRGLYLGLAYRLAPTIVVAITPVGNQVRISWEGTGTLQAASEVTGSYTNVSGATSGYLANPTATRMFYRVQQ